MTNPDFPDFRALAQELLDAYVWCIKTYIHNIPEKDTLVLRARAALATPPPKPPVDGEVPELVALIRQCALAWEPDARLLGNMTAAQLVRAAELLERTATPSPEPPTDEELLRLYGVATPCYHVEEFKRELDFARAALERWGK